MSCFSGCPPLKAPPTAVVHPPSSALDPNTPTQTIRDAVQRDSTAFPYERLPDRLMFTQAASLGTIRVAQGITNWRNQKGLKKPAP